MGYQVLARKWRPGIFADLVGQEHVVTAISNALDNNRLHHAYLFTGTRGVGKTTIARIFSKSLNCEEGQSANPCGKCPTCLEIEQGNYVDLLEIDAASRTKVEDTRELLDNVQYKPTRGRYKVYLIDEVHMLSKHSFNALLKTLEEPPPHVKFLLATTDPQKLPITILSRCLQFNLKAMSREQIVSQLDKILTTESISFEPPALNLLARAAQGSMRDALSLTDQAIAQGGNQVSAAVVTQMLGLMDKTQILKLTKAILDKSASDAMALVEDMSYQAPDYGQVLAELNSILHQIALTQLVPEACKLETTNARAIYQLAKQSTAEQIQLLYQIGIQGRKDLPWAVDGRSGFEMTLLRMLAFAPVPQASDAEDVISNMPSSSVPELTTQVTSTSDSSQTMASTQAGEVQAATTADSSDHDDVEAEAQAEALAQEQAQILAQAQRYTQDTTADVPNTVPTDTAQTSASTAQADPEPNPQPVAQPIPATQSEPAPQPEQAQPPVVDAQPLNVDLPPAHLMDGPADFDDMPPPPEQDEYFDPAGFVGQESQPEPDVQAAISPAEALSATQDMIALRQKLRQSANAEAENKSAAGKGGAGKKSEAADASSAASNPFARLAANAQASVESQQQESLEPTTTEVPSEVQRSQASHLDDVTDAVPLTPVNEPAESPVDDAPPWVLASSSAPIQYEEPAMDMATSVVPELEQVSDLRPEQAHQEPLESQPQTETMQLDTPQAQVQQPNSDLANELGLTAYLDNGEKLTSASQIDEWSQVISQMPIGGLIKQVALHSSYRRDGNKVFLELQQNQEHLLNDSSKNQIQISLSNVLGGDIELDVTLGNPDMTPYRLQQHIKQMRQSHAQHVMQTAPQFQSLQSHFDAELMVDTVQPR